LVTSPATLLEKCVYLWSTHFYLTSALIQAAEVGPRNFA
jgi:hypothetical protein